jgi:glycolate oxidase subunit GlcD
MQQNLAFLTSILPASRITDAREDLIFFGKDSCKEFEPNPSVIVFPETVDEVSQIVAACHERGIPIVPSGGRTGYSGGATATAQEVVLSLSKLNKILEIIPESGLLRCQAGVTTAAIQQKAKAEGLFYGVDFSSAGSSQIGGNVATNAGGLRVVRYGTTREWVVGLKVVLADGQLLTLNGDLIKNQTGYDLRQLFIGSEGTLGIIVEVTLKLTAPPHQEIIAMLAAQHPKHFFSALKELRKKRYTIQMFEYIDEACMTLVTNYKKLRQPFSESHPHYCLVSVEATSPDTHGAFQTLLSDLHAHNALSDVVIAQNTNQEKELCMLREEISDAIRQNLFPHKYDISAPVHSFDIILDSLRAIISQECSVCKAFYFGHIADGNIHISLTKPDTMSVDEFKELCHEADKNIFSVVATYNGSISAEHGIGLLRKPYLEMSRTKKEIDLMRHIKAAFDPRGILNPGKIFS